MQDRFCIKLADVCIGVQPLCEATHGFCAQYLAEDEKPTFELVMTEQALEREETLSRLYRGFGTGSREEAERLALYRAIAERMPQYSTFLMHGSAVAVDGFAYIFTAPSGTGKSTHAQLWQKRFLDRFVMINDDKPLLRIAGRDILVYGTPWAGKEGRNTNCCHPLKSMAFLRQADTNRLTRLEKGVCWDLLMNQIYRSGSVQTMTQTMQLLDQLISRIPIYQLECTMDPDAVRVSFEGLSGQAMEI